MVWSTNAAEHRDRDAVAPLDFLDYSQGRRLRRHAGHLQLRRRRRAAHAGGHRADGRHRGDAGDVRDARAAAGDRPPFTAQELQTAVVVSDRFWRARLGGDPGVLGQVLTIQDQPRTIVGVMPADFVFPYKSMLGPSGFSRATDVEAWLPLEFVKGNSRATGVAALTRSARFLSVVGRLKPGRPSPRRMRELAGIARQLAAAFPESNRVVGANVVPLHEQAVGALRPALVLLLGGVGFVLLIACVNLANLLLARSSARQREMAIRSALGAGRRRLMMQTLIETVMLAGLGGVGRDRAS